MSGRGLGFTGGTVDKLESILGYKTEIEESEFINNVKEIGISLISQTRAIAPADKKIYALRDTINCIDSIPLIASSIMSKKIASGADKIVLDVTVGNGAFMKNREEAEKLSKTMIDIGKLTNKQTVCVLTSMEEPLGKAIGNSLEVIEAIQCLKGQMPEDIRDVILELGSYMITLSGKCESLDEAKKMILETINNGKAFDKFVELVEKQGGDISYLYDTNKFKKADYILPVIASQDGYIEKIEAEKIGKISAELGAGRIKKEDKIDNTVGIILNKKVGDIVHKGEIIGFVHSNDNEKGKQAVKDICEIVQVSNNKINKYNAVISVLF